MMKFWGEEPVRSDRDIEILANELWKSKEQFEAELREEHDKRDYAMEALRKKERMKAQYLKEQCMFRMQAMESALIQTKTKCQLDCERAYMIQAEMESKMLNLEKDDDQIQQELRQMTISMKDGIDFTSKKGQDLA